MDQDKEVAELPAHLQGYKDVEKRKAWLKKYHRERYHKLKAQKREADIMTETKKAGELSDDQFNKALGAISDTLGKEDPIAQAIDKYGKYVPLVVNFLKGFGENMKAHQAAQISQQQRGPEPPPGWLQLSALQKMNKKYDGTGNITPWYQAGVAYDQAMESGGIAEGIMSHQPVPMETTQHGRRMATQQRQQAAAAADNRSMADLNAQAENEKWDSNIEMANAPEVERKDGQPGTINEAIANKKQDQQEQQSQEAQALKEIGDGMMADNQKYIGLVLNYFETRPINEFEKDLENVDETFKKWEPMMGFLPMQARHLIQTTTVEELEAQIKSRAPDKIALIKKKKLRQKLVKLWEKVKKSVE